MFYLTYILFEIPGAVIVERWSARRWFARIMVSWGIVTILTGFVHTAAQFYAARFLLGAAESSFFPGMIVYLTHWFCARDRGRALRAAEALEGLFDQPPARCRARSRQHGDDPGHPPERLVEQRPVAPLDDLQDPRFVPQVDAV